jgi:stress response protein YsnF
VIVKKRTVVRNETVRATLRRETIDVDADDGVHVVEGEA